MIKFDCANDCIHKGICIYEEARYELNRNLKRIEPNNPNIDFLVKCKHYSSKFDFQNTRGITYEENH